MLKLPSYSSAGNSPCHAARGRHVQHDVSGARAQSFGPVQHPFRADFKRAVSTTSLGALRRAIATVVEITREKRATYTGANNPYPYGRNLGAVRFGLQNESLYI